MSTVEKADKIVLINKGRVEQVGTHDELFSQEGMYRSLVQRQMINANGGTSSSPTTFANFEPPAEINAKSVTTPADYPSSPAALSVSPRSMVYSLLATSFTQSTSSLQSK